MASTDARPVPRKNVAYRLTFPIFKNDGTLISGATALDSEVDKDAAGFADCTNEATEIATSSGIYYLDLTSTEMNADCVSVKVGTTSTGACIPVFVLYPQESGDILVNLADGVQGGTAATLVLKTIAVSTSTAGEPAVSITASGTGNAHGVVVTASGGGKGVAIGAAAVGLAIDSSASDAVQIQGGTNSDGIQVAGNGTGVSIRGDLSGSVGSVTAEVTADMQKVNGVALVGDGNATPWGP